jgi:hypothetical protein
MELTSIRCSCSHIILIYKGEQVKFYCQNILVQDFHLLLHLYILHFSYSVSLYFKMVQFTSLLLTFLATSFPLALAAPAPAPTPAPDLSKRATTCTFTNAASVSVSKKSCATIVLNNIAVPSGTTLDLTSLTAGTHVIFQGTTTFGFEQWSGPLVSVSGTSITVTGDAGSVIDGGGSRWWDGLGSNGYSIFLPSSSP